MKQAFKETDFRFDGQTDFYRGKVRDVYFFGDKVAMVATDRISAFDVVLPRPIPYKGQVLNQLAAKAMEATKDIVPNWIEKVPDPNVTMGKRCEALPVEMVIRGYLAGHAWREYRDGKRTICGVSMPEGLKENDRFPEPLITPTTKAHEGHDEDISREEILKQGLVPEDIYVKLEEYTRALYKRGSELAAKQGLILVDTKYEFGLYNGEVYLIDEVHTPDSSRYFYTEGYEDRQQAGEVQRQLSKEFVRQWLIQHGFQGQGDQQIPVLPDEFVQTVTNRYIELYEKFTGETFQKPAEGDALERIRKNINLAL
ncbi:phosphoribosylaminoimidazolesuccinocarboxamide synthase [Roseivirga sp. BDSF3-8]|uniref:phosphoribosylaminoimidazolesuccinocarboxamide synthase n=1 Tax=Roseivirga sp. BDSF3-8 TaxID=3241598 RepID=UPI003531B1D7